jgi:hypothetical protein
MHKLLTTEQIEKVKLFTDISGGGAVDQPFG